MRKENACCVEADVEVQEVVLAKINGSNSGWNTILQGSAATLTATQGRNLDGRSIGHKVIVDGEIKWDDNKGPGPPSSGAALVKDIDSQT